MTAAPRRLTSLVAILAMLFSVLVATALPADAQAAEDYSILVFSKTAGFRHTSIEAGIQAIEDLGAANNVAIDATEDATAFTEENLDQYAAVVFLSTTGDVLNPDQQAAFESYIQTGGGYAGIHAASDTEYDWAWYGDLVGAYFDSHPAGTPTATVITEDPAHPSTAHLPTRWERTDEWYNFQTNPRGDVHVLQSVDESTYDAGGGSMGLDHPISWCQDYDGGRSWYTALGHTEASFSEPEFLTEIWGGIETAAGQVSSDCGATLTDNFQKVTLDDDTTAPMALEVTPDGRIFYVQRTGQFKVIQPDGGTTTAGTLPVTTVQEFGLIGLALDPDFATNNWVYLTYSPSAGTGDQVSRFTMDGDTLDLDSEVEIINIPTQRAQCCHAGGELEFDSEGVLYLATGDNTNPFDSSGYTPIDERPGREPWDAQRSSANTNSLSGKLLRIIPLDEGGYDIPAGNLQDTDWAADKDADLIRDEIYAMGFRNPFRFGIDPLTDKVVLADYGPDAGSANPNRGPDGRVEWNIVDEPGNYGWPYCVGDNTPYIDYDFATSTSGDAFDCANPVNDSPNNTGLTDLPPAIAAEEWFGRSSTGTPEVGNVGAPMASAPYRYDADLDSDVKWPAYWDGKSIFADWNRTTNAWWSFQVDDDVDKVEKINPVFTEYQFIRTMDFQWGPDGALYIIEWGNGYGDNNPDSGVYKIEYVGGDRSPVARIDADPTSGALPLEVTFSAARSNDPDGGDITYAWDFDGDGTVDSTDVEDVYTYTEGGDYTASLTVTDDEGDTATDSVVINAGNTPPVIDVLAPLDGGFFSFGDTVAYEVDVTDAEDAAIDCSQLVTQPALGHDQHAHPYDQFTGCSGSFPIPGDTGHVGADIFGVITFTYTDTGGEGGAGSLRTQEVVKLNLRHTEAEYFAETGRTADGVGGGDPGVVIEATGDVDGGQNIGFIEDGDWWSMDPANLSGIDSVDFRVASAGAGGEIEIHTDAPDGPIVGTATVEPTGDWQTFTTVTADIAAGTTSDSIYFVANSPTDNTGGLFNVNWMKFDGVGVSDNRAPEVEVTATPMTGEAPLDVDFAATAIDPEGDSPLTFDWTFGDGEVGEGADIMHTYTSAGDYTATVTVSDPDGASASESVVIEVDFAPGPGCDAGFLDDFDGDALSDDWSVVRPDGNLRVEDSGLVIPLTATDIFGTNNTDTPNIVHQALPDGDFEITTKVTAQLYDAYQQAGLVLYEDDDNYVKFVMQGRNDGAEDPAARVLQMVSEVDATPAETNSANLGAGYPDTVWLRLVGTGDTITALSSIDDGATWTEFSATANRADFENLQMGMFALSGTGQPADEEAVFDWFEYAGAGGGDAVDPNDEFSGTELALCRWTDSVRLDDTQYEVADGELTIQTAQGDIYTTPNGDVANFILQPQPGDSWTVETKLNTSALVEQYQQGGLLVWADDDNYVKFDHVVDNAAGSTPAGRLELRSEVDGVITNPQPGVDDVGPQDELWLRLTRDGDTFTGSYSLDGETFTDLSEGVTNALAASDGSVGIFTIGTNQAAPVPVSFDYFRVEGGGGGGDGTAPTVSSTLLGTFAGSFRPTTGADIEGTGQLTVTGDSTTISVDVSGLQPNFDYSGHLHLGSCGENLPHYRDDPDGPTMPPNELWLSDSQDPAAGFTTDADGNATASGTADWTARATAQSIMVHVGPSGLPIGCVDVDTSEDPVTVQLDAMDADDDVDYVEYRIDGGDWMEYTTSFVVSDIGDHTVEYRATDTEGNTSDIESLSFTIADEDTPRILSFSRTAGFRHGSIPAAKQAVQELANANGAIVDITEDPNVFTESYLANYDAVVFLETTGNVLDGVQQDAFESYIQSGGGYAGVHSASDTEYDWEWYGDLVGAYFVGHPAGTPEATLDVEDPDHPSTSHLPTRWTRVDEWYSFQENPRDNVHVLLSIDESTYDVGGLAMGDHPMAWCQDYDGGRSWYTALGHTSASYATDTDFREHLWGGIATAAGLVDADCSVDSADPLTLDVTLDPAEPDGRDGWYVTPVTVTATTNDDATIEFSVDGGAWVADDDGVLVVDTDGSHTLDVRAVRGDATSEVESFTMDIDTTAPELTVDGITDGQEFVQGAGDEITWSATDDTSGMRVIRVRLDGVIIDRDLPAGGPFVPGSLEPGSYELFVRAHDVAGNFTTQRYDFTVVPPPDTTRPTVTVTGVRDGATYGDSRVLDITASASDDGGIDRIRVILDGQRIYQGDSPWELSLPLWDLDLGEHRLRVVAWDTAGNRRAVNIDFTVGTSITDVFINLDRFNDAGVVTNGDARRIRDHLAKAERFLDVGKTAQARRQLQDARDDARRIDDYDVQRLLVRDLTELIRDLDGTSQFADTTADALANQRAAEKAGQESPELVPTPDFLEEDGA